jgi:hypothetical protein
MLPGSRNPLIFDATAYLDTSLYAGRCKAKTGQFRYPQSGWKRYILYCPGECVLLQVKYLKKKRGCTG